MTLMEPRASSTQPRELRFDLRRDTAPRTDRPEGPRATRVALLTGGKDKPYALGLASALLSQGILLDVIGSDYVDSPELHSDPRVCFLNLRGDTRRNATWIRKITRVLKYYVRLVG